jgi:hypothetical protein
MKIREKIERDGIKTTSKNYLVDLDEYTERDRYYTGSPFGIVLAISREAYPSLLKEGYSEGFETELDAIISLYYTDRVLCNGVKVYRKGGIVQ